LRRPHPKVAPIVLPHPPAHPNLTETRPPPRQVLPQLRRRPRLQVSRFPQRRADFFFNHFDLAAAADFPVPDGEDAIPMWTDIVLRLSKAPYVTIASIRGRTRGGGNELALAFDLRYASREHAMFGAPDVASALLP